MEADKIACEVYLCCVVDVWTLVIADAGVWRVFFFLESVNDVGIDDASSSLDDDFAFFFFFLPPLEEVEEDFFAVSGNK